MKIYDAEILNIVIDDVGIADLLTNNQRDIVENNLRLMRLEKNLEYNTRAEELTRKELDEKVKTDNKKTEVSLKEEENKNKVLSTEFKNKKDLENAKLTAENGVQKTLDAINTSRLAREKANEDQSVALEKERSSIRVKEIESEMKAITPGL